MTVTGFLGAVPVGSLALNSSSLIFQNVASGFAGLPIDLLRIEVTVDGTNALLIDNVNLTPTAVPEPAALLIIATGVLAVARWRRRR